MTRFEQGRLAIHLMQVSAWTWEFPDRAEKAFGNEPSREEESVDVNNLSKQISQHQVENDRTGDPVLKKL